MNLPGYHIDEQIPSPEGVLVHRAHRVADGLNVVIKTARSADAEIAARLQRHAEIGALYHFANVANVVELIDRNDTVHLVTETAGPLSLRALIRDGSVTRRKAWYIMRGIVSALDELHGMNIVHGDLHPGNIIVDIETNNVKLIDLGLSFVIGQTSQSESMGVMEGAVAYMAPEKTGRTSYMVDTRSDLYSAGVIFYELLVGRLPFAHKDMLELVHAHLAQVPPRVRDHAPDISRSLSDLIALLLVKDPESRYQSAYGVMSDLTLIEEADAEAEVTLRTRDVNERYSRRSAMVGRTAEITALRSFLEEDGPDVAARILSASAGMGKSALVSAFTLMAQQHGLVVARGECDRSAEVPLSGISSVADRLVRAILRSPEINVEQWIRDLTTELDSTLATVASVVPILATVIDIRTQDVATISAGDAQRRLTAGLLAFFSVTTRRVPTVLIVEDVQWADDATLDLLEMMTRADRSQHSKLLLSYRSDDPDISDSTTQKLEQLTSTFEPEHQLHLAGLAASDVDEMIASAFNLPAAEHQQLVTTVISATSGSPLFIEQYLGLLVEHGALTYDRRMRQWQYHERARPALQATDGLSSVLVRRFSAFTPDQRRVLAVLASMGSRTSLQDLIDVLGSRDIVMPALSHAVANGVLIRHITDDDAFYSFVHDKLRVHAESLINDLERHAVHRDYTLLLLRRYREQNVESLIYRVADHATRVPRSMFTGETLVEIMDILDKASAEAKRSGVINAALHYLTVAIEIESLVPAGPSSTVFERHIRFAELLGNSGSLPQAHEELDRLDRTTADPFRSARLAHLRLILLNLESRYAESITVGRKALALLGVKLPTKPSQLTVGTTLARVWRRQARLNFDVIATRPLCSDQGALLAMDVLQYLQAPSYNTDENLFACVLLERSDLVFRYGHGDASVDSYATFGVFLRTVGAVRRATSYADLAIKLSRTSKDLRARANSVFVANTIVYHWTRPLSEVVDGLHQSVQLAEFSGDTAILAYASGVTVGTAWYAGHSFQALQQRVESYLPKLVQAWQHQDFPPTIATYYHAGLLRFISRHAGHEPFNDDALLLLAKYDDIYADVMKSGNATAICYLLLFEATSALIDGHHREFHEHISGLAPWGRGMIGQALTVIAAELTAIDHALAVTNGADPGKQQKLIQRELKKFRSWEQHHPATFRARRLVVEACSQWCAGDRDQALRSLDSAAAEANVSGDVLTSRIVGALATAIDPHLSVSSTPPVAAASSDPKRYHEVTYASSHAAVADELDIASVVKATTTIAQEIDLASLHNRLLRILVENAGASRALIIDPQGESHTVVASYGSTAIDSSRMVIREASWTKHPVVVNDASASEYSADPHVAATGVRSILAFPVLHQGRISCLLYLENGNIAGAFSAERLRFLELLAGQIAVSLENARLYDEQKRTLESAAKFVPSEFLDSLGIASIRDVKVGTAVETPMTVLFADIRGFTSISETLSVTETFTFLNSYLSVVAPCIAEHGGFIDKYIGDAVMALFPRSPSDAVAAALAMIESLRNHSGREVSVGIGIHTGNVMLGTVGSSDRMDTTVIGDTVNLAARLEEMTKEMPWSIIISDDVLRSLPPDMDQATDLGTVLIRGRSTPLIIHGIEAR